MKRYVLAKYDWTHINASGDKPETGYYVIDTKNPSNILTDSHFMCVFHTCKRLEKCMIYFRVADMVDDDDELESLLTRNIVDIL